MFGEAGADPPRVGRFARVRGRKVHYLAAGHGRPVLLLHGNGSIGQEILSCFPSCEGIRWIAPDRPGYGYSEPLRPGEEGPRKSAAWTADFMDSLGFGRVEVAAHSIACAAALHLAAARPERVERLVLLAPFCRPTPHRWKPALRLAVAPVVGAPVRDYVVPAVAALFRRRILKSMMSPNPVPPWLRRFPVTHAAQSQSLMTTAAELRRFNADMAAAPSRLRISADTLAVFGAEDETAPPEWHEPWLRQHVARLRCVRLSGAGHAVHHAAPLAVLKAIAGTG